VEFQKWRKTLVQKAQPVPIHRPFKLPSKSTKPLTNPTSPKFEPMPAERRRLKRLHPQEEPIQLTSRPTHCQRRRLRRSRSVGNYLD